MRLFLHSPSALVIRSFAALALLLAFSGCKDEEEPSAAPQDTVPEVNAEKDTPTEDTDQGAKLPPPDLPGEGRHILFGDLHVHSTYSLDAMVTNSPLLAGAGFAGPTQRCDFARFCSQLDFWAITDHPEYYTPEMWEETKEAVRSCNALEGGLSDNPRLVTFLGWEWTQNAQNLEEDWGHKNVFFKDVAEDQVPARPIAARSTVVNLDEGLVKGIVATAKMADSENAALYDTMGETILAELAVPECEKGQDTRSLPVDCREVADDPAELYEKLDQWGFDALVIPHGNAWGVHHPPLASWAVQQNRTQHRPEYERLVEVYSGHGSMEEYRPWRHALVGDDGALSCPEPQGDFLPCCWRAGEIMRERAEPCLADPKSDDCEQAVARARQAYLDEEPNGARNKDLDASPEDWLDCGQCNDCFQPAFIYRPAFTVQAAFARTDFSKPEEPLRYRFGLIGSTDSHEAGPGAGYKEGREQTDNFGPGGADYAATVEAAATLLFREWERQNNYWYSGGLVAVHARSRDRDAIWEALKRREVYATTGERILLSFELVNGPGGEPRPMGSIVELDEAPTFEVRAVGSFKQAPGCPEEARAKAPEGFIEKDCFGECYNPTDERHLITRVEVVRIRPQIKPDEALEDLIEDPWKTLTCPADPAGCTVRFEDPEHTESSRPAVYYVRAIQSPTPQFNAENFKCERDASGRCTSVSICLGGIYKVDGACTAEDEERAWSSPIFVD